MGSRKIFRSHETRNSAKLNTDAIKHAYDNYNNLLNKYLSRKVIKYLISKKYTDYAELSLANKNVNDTLYFLNKSFDKNVFFRLLPKYLNLVIVIASLIHKIIFQKKH